MIKKWKSIAFKKNILIVLFIVRYEGAFYKIEARFFEDYPISAPQLKFDLTTIKWYIAIYHDKSKN